MNQLDVHLKLNNLHCYDEADGPGSAEPYLWTVFFKIDGDTTVVNPSFALQGTATVVTTTGNQGDLPNHAVDAGENVPIPTSLGDFKTRLKPIPLQHPVGNTTETGGVVGLITVLLEEDKTKASAVAKGHLALNKAVKDSLNALIPTLNIGHSEPTPAEIEAMKKKIGDTVTAAIKSGVGFWDWLGAVGNMDDKIGSEVFRFSHSQLEAGGVSGIGFSQRFKNEGDWELSGRIVANPVGIRPGNLNVTISGIPATVAMQPVTVRGPGFNRTVGTTSSFSGLVPGAYTVEARNFTTAPNKPTCRLFTPAAATQHVNVVAGQTAGAAVRYTSGPCDEL